MPKPLAKHVEFDLGIALGRLVINTDTLQVFNDAGEQAAVICLDDRAEAAAVLLAAAQHLLAGCSEEVSKEGAFRGGTLRGFGSKRL